MPIDRAHAKKLFSIYNFLDSMSSASEWLLIEKLYSTSLQLHHCKLNYIWGWDDFKTR